MNNLRQELRRASKQRFKRVELDRFKVELKYFITHFLFENTGKSPIVIPVVNVIGGKGDIQKNHSNGKQKTPEEIALEQQKRFAQMRERLLNQDPRS